MLYMRILVIVLYIGTSVAESYFGYPCAYSGDPSCGSYVGHGYENDPPIQWCGQTFTDIISSGRIINGVESKPHEFPWMTKLVVDNYFFCGGSLIANNYVITAGHCVANHIKGTPPKNMRVEFGVNAFVDDYPPVKSPVLKIILHPNYDVFVSHDYMMQTNDVAVLRIHPIQFSKFVIPVCLPQQGEIVPDGTMMTVAGWGLVQEESEDHKQQAINPDVLMKNSMRKISWRECRNNPQSRPYLAPENDLTDNHIICMIGSNTDACQGDSGGGVVQRTTKGFVLQGIVSWGIGCNRPNFPSAYTRVASYVRFILNHTKDAHYLPMKPRENTWWMY